MRREKLMALRKAKGLTQVQVGKKIGLGREAIALYEGGLRMPSIATAMDLAAVYGVTLDEICAALGVAPRNNFVRGQVSGQEQAHE
jgi:transcriptional regulator with XRE-family HTH domain